jgi:hypothetical protein
MKTNLLLAVAFVIESCIFAEAADPNSNNKQPAVISAVEAATPSANSSTQAAIKFLTAVETAKPSTIITPYQFPGKLVRVQMTGGTRNDCFVLENVTFVPLNPLSSSEWFIIGTGIKNGPRQTVWCEGLEVHLNLRLVASYCPMTPEQWKDHQRSTSTPPAGPIPFPPQPAAVTPLVPPQPATLDLAFPTPLAVPNPALPTPSVVPLPALPSQPTVPLPALPTPHVVPNPLPPSQPVAVPPPTSSIDAARLNSARAERVKLLTQVVEIVTSQYKSGTVDFSLLFSAESELSNALLDSIDEPEKRIAVLTKQLDRASDFVKLTKARFDAAGGSEVDLNRAKSQYLDLEIKLLQERSRMKPPTATPVGKRP